MKIIDNVTACDFHVLFSDFSNHVTSIAVMENEHKEVGQHDYWDGEGRKLIVIPQKIIRQKIINNFAINQLYISELGHYPVATKHYTLRKNGCAEMVVMFCVNGKGDYGIKSDTHQVLPGQFFILPPDISHEYRADLEDPWSIYWLKIGGINISKFSAQASLKKCRKPIYVKDLREVCSLLDDLIDTLTDGYSDDRIMYANFTLQRILALMIYDIHVKKVVRVSDKAISLMKKDVAGKFKLADLASKHAYSASQFSNIFKMETGFAPIEFSINLKIQYACELLQTTNMKIYQIAVMTGYQDPYHFSKIFKSIMAVSPAKYRKLNNR